MATTFTEDGNGNVTGTIEIPDGLLTGVKEIEIIGDQGTVAKTLYADGTYLSPITRRGLRSQVPQGIAPVAQTFYVDKQLDVIGAEVYLDVKGDDGDLFLQIRNVDAGIPNQDILSETCIKYADLATGWVRGLFTATNLLPGVEYALVAYSPNNAHKLGTAALGGVDTNTGEAITRQSYQQGVLLTSSNGTAWSIHPNQDLAFKILGSKYTSTTKTVALGTVAGTNVTDFIILGEYERPTRDTQVEFIITSPAGDVFTVDKDTPTRLPTKQTGDFVLQAKLTGTSSVSPVLFRDTQLILGTLVESDKYVSEFITVEDPFDLTIKLEHKLETGATLQVQVETGSDDNWSTMSVQAGTSYTMNDGFQYVVYKISTQTGVDRSGTDKTRIRLNLDGVVTGRPFIRNLVGIIS